MNNPKTTITTVITHSGIFHADDVFCVALLKILVPEIEVERKREATQEDFREDTIVVDIGYGKYDHHQENPETRKDGRKHAAVGLLYRDLKKYLFPDPVYADAFEKNYIIPIEDADNGIAPNSLSLAIASMNPNWDSEISYDEAFCKAVDFAQSVIQREIDKAFSEQKGRDIVLKALSEMKDGIVVLPQYVPWDKVLCPSNANFVIYPSARGGYHLQSVPINPDGFDIKKALPEKWLKTKPEGCTFVHQKLFIAVFDSEEQAVKAAYSEFQNHNAS